MRAGALGDLLLLRRAIAGLKALGHRVSLMAPAAPARALLGPGPSEVDEVLDWDDPAFLSLFVEDDSPQKAVAVGFEAFSACIAYTGERHLVLRLERLIPRVIAQAPAPLGVHAATWLAKPTLALGAKPPALPPDMEATASEEAQAEAFVAGRLAPGFLAIHPGSGGPTKNWPAEHFARLAHELGSPPSLLIEGPADAASRSELEAGPFVLASHLPLRTLGAVLRRAGLFVGNDSGVTHLAAGWGAPTLALFGPTDPTTWSPVGRLVAVVRSRTASMDDLSPADVSRAARALRSAGHGPEPPILR